MHEGRLVFAQYPGRYPIHLCLALFPWARFRKHKGAVTLHTPFDLRGNIPTFIHI